MLEKKTEELVMIGRRRKYRPLLKFRKRDRVEDAVWATQYDKVQGAKERELRREGLKITARLARRPLEKYANFDQLGIVVHVRRLRTSEILRLLKIIHAVLDSTSRSMALMNLRAALGEESKVLFLRLEIRSSTLMVRGLQKKLK